MEFLYFWYTLSRISWQEMQNDSELVSSMPQLKPPQKIIPATKAAVTKSHGEYVIRRNSVEVHPPLCPLLELLAIVYGYC